MGILCGYDILRKWRGLETLPENQIPVGLHYGEFSWPKTIVVDHVEYERHEPWYGTVPDDLKDTIIGIEIYQALE